MQRKNKNKL